MRMLILGSNTVFRFMLIVLEEEMVDGYLKSPCF